MAGTSIKTTVTADVWVKISNGSDAIAITVRALTGQLKVCIATSLPNPTTEDDFELLEIRQLTHRIEDIPAGYFVYVITTARGSATISVRPSFSAAAPALLNKKMLASVAGNNATLVKAGLGKVYQITGKNVAGTQRFLKIYNKATAPVTNGGDTAVATYILEPLQPFSISLGGLFFPLGIGYAITASNTAENDNSSINVGDIVAFNMLYS